MKITMNPYSSRTVNFQSSVIFFLLTPKYALIKLQPERSRCFSKLWLSANYLWALSETWGGQLHREIVEADEVSKVSILKCLKRSPIRSLSFGKFTAERKTAAMTMAQNIGEKIKFDTCWFFCCWSLICGRKPKMYWIHSNTGVCKATSVRSWQGELH